MPEHERVVLDTNVVLSGLLFPGAIPSLALLKAQNSHFLGSDATMLEIVEVMNRPRFDRYLERSLRQQLVAEYLNACEAVPILFPIRACRDPKDDKFLEVAVHGRADAIVTGDADLLDLNPFSGIVILTPREYLGQQ
jgi:putative PIN family toxin of toxin-antitoxin system